MNNLPKLCEDDFDSLIEKFSLLVSDYTPEWSFDISDDDLGVTFGKIFCKMQEDTIDRLNKSVNNIYLTILKFIDVQLSPCTPSKCFAFVKATKNSKPHIVKKGSKITSSSKAIFETDYDFFVCDNSIENIFMSSRNAEKLVKVFNSKDEFKKFQIFNFSNHENIQKRYMYIYDENLFDICGSYIYFKFQNKFSRAYDQKLFDSVSSGLWEFFDGKNWIKVDKLEKLDDSSIRIIVNKRPKKCKVESLESIYFRILFLSDCDIRLSNISYYIDTVSILPDQVLSGDEMVDISSAFLPFKEKFYLYDTFIIKCNEAFNKPGAKISISVDMKFVEFSSEFKNYIINYKMIMSDVDFAETEPIDINIEKVVWEYMKNDAWVPLKTLTKDSDKFFCGSSKSGEKVLEFICPDDINEGSFLSYSGLFIRARIIKISNQYSNYFNYISPRCENIKVEYSYDSPHKCKEVILYSNLEYRKVNMLIGEKEEIDLFNIRENNAFAIYLNLRNPISEGILNIFFNIEDNVNQNGMLFKWEYFGRNYEGTLGWKPLRIVDYTDSFSKSGTVRILGSKDFVMTKLFNENGYFIKISLLGDEKVIKHFPIIKDIQLNSVEVTQKETSKFEYFFVNEYEKNKVCSISSKSSYIFDVEVWIDEKESISSDECAKLTSKNSENIEIENNSDNTVKKIWVKWRQINNISNAGPLDRVYEFDNKSREVRFGDGNHGKLPSEFYGRNIRVRYCASEGENGNIDEMSLSSFSSNLSYVSSVYNKEKSYGGTDIESLDHASIRTFSQISMGNRLVSAKGFEQGILFNDRRIFKVKCFSHIDRYENKSEGCITVVILPKDYMRGVKTFSIIRKNALDFMNRNAPVSISNSGRVFVSEVSYVKFSFRILVYIDDYRNYQKIRDEIHVRIKNFLDPIKGGSNNNGFSIGDIPSKSDILNKIRFIEGVQVRQFEIFTKILTEYGEKEMLLDEVEKLKFTTPIFESIDLDVKYGEV